MRIVYTNYIDDYDITATSENSSYPADNVKDTRISKYWRSTGVTAQSISIDAGAGNTLNPTFGWLANHNFTSSATIKIQGSDAADFSSTPVDVTLTWAAGNISKFFTGTARRYWRFYFNDPTNTDLYLKIGRLYLSVYTQVTNAHDISFSEENIDTTTVNQSRSGQHYANEGIIIKQYGLTFPYWDSTMKATMQTILETVKKAGKLILVLDENDLTTWPPLYCFMNQDMNYQHLFAKAVSSKMIFTEAK